MDKQIILIPGPNNIKLVLDPHDADTPAMLFGGTPSRRDGLGRHSATYECALDSGELGHDGEVVLTSSQIKFLEQASITKRVEAVEAAARPVEV